MVVCVVRRLSNPATTNPDGVIAPGFTWGYLLVAIPLAWGLVLLWQRMNIRLMLIEGGSWRAWGTERVSCITDRVYRIAGRPRHRPPPQQDLICAQLLGREIGRCRRRSHDDIV